MENDRAAETCLLLLLYIIYGFACSCRNGAIRPAISSRTGRDEWGTGDPRPAVVW